MNPVKTPMKSASPFNVKFKDNKLEFALARMDDLVNWGRKVYFIQTFMFFFDIDT